MMSASNQTACTTEEKSSTSVFLWKAAISTINFHPAVTANLLLRCRKALNDTKVGVKFRKISKSNICQSCGNPWSLGNYKIEIRKTFKATKLKKILKQSKNLEKMNGFNKHMLERYSERKSSFIIKCDCCFKSTSFPTPLPPKVSKPVKPIASHSENLKKKKCKKDKSAVKDVKPCKKQDKQKPSKNPMKPSKGMPHSTKQTFSRNQLKNISKTLTKGASVKSSLQTFLSSVK